MVLDGVGLVSPVEEENVGEEGDQEQCEEDDEGESVVGGSGACLHQDCTDVIYLNAKRPISIIDLYDRMVSINPAQNSAIDERTYAYVINTFKISRRSLTSRPTHYPSRNSLLLPPSSAQPSQVDLLL